MPKAHTGAYARNKGNAYERQIIHELEEIGCHFINLPDNLFYGNFDVCGFVVWGRQ